MSKKEQRGSNRRREIEGKKNEGKERRERARTMKGEGGRVSRRKTFERGSRPYRPRTIDETNAKRGIQWGSGDSTIGGPSTWCARGTALKYPPLERGKRSSVGRGEEGVKEKEQ